MSTDGLQVGRLAKVSTRHWITKMNSKSPRASFTNKTGDQLSVCHCRQLDRTRRHAEKSVLERDTELYPSVHIYGHKQPTTRCQQLIDPRKPGQRG